MLVRAVGTSAIASLGDVGARGGPRRPARRRGARARRSCGRRAHRRRRCARWPACSAMSRCISWHTRRYAGWPCGAVRSSSMCIASRAFICIANRMRYASDTAYGACSGNVDRRARRTAPRRVPSRRRTASASPASRDRLGDLVAVTRRERLPLDREHAVTLQVAERAVVGEHVEAVVDALERAARAVTPVVARPRRTPRSSATRSSAPSVRTRASTWSSGRWCAGSRSRRAPCPRRRDRSR